MASRLREEVRERLARRESPARIRTALLESGFGEEEVEEALRDHSEVYLKERDENDKRNSRILFLTELLDRIGYGTAPPPFLNILFYQTGAGLFLLGLFHGLKTVVSLLLTSITQEYAKVHRVAKGVIGGAGILFGFSFLLMALALTVSSPWLFAAALLLSGIGVVAYGDLYNTFVAEVLRREKRGSFLARISQYGVLITMVAMLLSGWIIDLFPPTSGRSFTILGLTFTPVGYLISFEVTAIAFILSGYLLTLLREVRQERRRAFLSFVREHAKTLFAASRNFFTQKYLCLLLTATIITGILEILGQSYYGLFIYQQFKYEAFGGFTNVAVIYGIAIMASFTGPWFTQKLKRSIGLTPMLVFGTLLSAILPFTLWYNVNILAVALALAFSVMGAAITGVAQGLLTRKLLGESSRRKYFMSIGLFVLVPYLFLIPLGSWFTAVMGMRDLFLAIGLSLVIIVVPLYFLLVAIANKQRL